MPDNRLEPRLAGKTPTKYKFVGEHPDLITGNFYTISEISKVVNIKNGSMHSRMMGKTEITNKELRKVETKYREKKRSNGNLTSNLETISMKQSAKWLRVKL